MQLMVKEDGDGAERRTVNTDIQRQEIVVGLLAIIREQAMRKKKITH